MKRVVLDTNCLIAIISSRSEHFVVWKSLHEGKFVLCVTNDILAEYEEILALKTNAIVAENVINALVESDSVEFFDPQYKLNLITADPDDNKFVDCAFAANASIIVSNDKHFSILSSIDFPRISVLRLEQFTRMMSREYSGVTAKE